jgi:hypothetical protein
MQWTNYDPYISTKAVSRIHVTLGPRGVFYLNAGAMRKLGEPVAVRLMFNKEEGLIGITPVPLKAKGAIELRAKYGDDSPGALSAARPSARNSASSPNAQ